MPLRWSRCVFLRRGVRKKSHAVLKPLSYFARRLTSLRPSPLARSARCTLSPIFPRLLRVISHDNWKLAWNHRSRNPLPQSAVSEKILDTISRRVRIPCARIVDCARPLFRVSNINFVRRRNIEGKMEIFVIRAQRVLPNFREILKCVNRLRLVYKTRFICYQNTEHVVNTIALLIFLILTEKQRSFCDNARNFCFPCRFFCWSFLSY